MSRPDTPPGFGTPQAPRARQSVQTSRRRWVIPAIAVVVVLALVAGLSAWSYATNRWPFNPASGSYRALGTTAVGVDKGAPKSITAVVDFKAAKPQFQLLQPLGDVTHITPDGNQTSEITLRFTLHPKVTDPKDVLIATSKTGKPGSWELMAPNEVSKDGQYAYVKTTHLSWWQPLWRSFTDLTGAVVAELKRQLDGLDRGATAEADQPKCQDEQTAKTKGYSIKRKGAEVLYYCLGLVNGQPVAQISNKRRYPIFINHRGISVPDKPKSKIGLELLGRQAFSNDRTVMMPFDQLKLHYELSKGQSKSFTTEYNGFAEALYQLEFGITTLINILTRFGAGGGTISNGAIKISEFDKVAEKMSAALQIKDCFNAINTDNPNSGEILAGCFDPAALADMFGWKGVLLATVMVVGPVINFFRNSFDTLKDLLSGGDQEAITVAFNPPAEIPEGLAGKWSVHGMTAPLVIDSKLTTTYGSNDGPCGSDGSLCNRFVTVKFNVLDKNTLSGTYTKVWYQTWKGAPAPADVYKDPTIQPGKTFTITRNPDMPGDTHTLKTFDGTGARPGNPYLCDGFAESQNNTEKYQLCGA